MFNAVEEEERRRANARKAQEARQKAKRKEEELRRTAEAVTEELGRLREEEARCRQSIARLEAQLAGHYLREDDPLPQGFPASLGGDLLLQADSGASLGIGTDDDGGGGGGGGSLLPLQPIPGTSSSWASSSSSSSWWAAAAAPEEPDSHYPHLTPTALGDHLDQDAGGVSETQQKRTKKVRKKKKEEEKGKAFSYLWPPQEDAQLEARRQRAIRAREKRELTKAKTQELLLDIEKVEGEVEDLRSEKKRIEARLQRLTTLMEQTLR